MSTTWSPRRLAVTFAACLVGLALTPASSIGKSPSFVGTTSAPPVVNGRDAVLLTTSAGVRILRDGHKTSQKLAVPPGCRPEAASGSTAVLRCGSQTQELARLFDLETGRIVPVPGTDRLGPYPWSDFSVGAMGRQWIIGLACEDKCLEYTLNWHTGELRRAVAFNPYGPFLGPFLRWPRTALDSPTLTTPAGGTYLEQKTGKSPLLLHHGAVAKKMRGFCSQCLDGVAIQGTRVAWGLGFKGKLAGTLRITSAKHRVVREVPRFGKGEYTVLAATRQRIVATFAPPGGTFRVYVLDWPRF